MADYLNLRLYKRLGGMASDSEVSELIESVIKESGLFDESGEKGYDKSPYRTISVILEDGVAAILDRQGEELKERKLSGQLSNELLIQIELQNIRKWDPMRYSRAYGPEEDIAWDLLYNGLTGKSISLHGEGSYPRNWQVLVDILEAFISLPGEEDDSLHIAGGYFDELTKGRSRYALDMVSILSSMGMPGDVIAAGVLREASREKKYDPEFIKENFDSSVAMLLDEYGGADPSKASGKWELVTRAKDSDSLYFKRVVLAESLAELIGIRHMKLEGEDMKLPMSFDDYGAYYAGMISALEPLDSDEKAGASYRKLVDLYKEVFVKYEIDSFKGIIYQIQGESVAVGLKRGEYDWKPVEKEDPWIAEPLHKELALFIASLWKREADDAIVKDGNKNGSYDVPDIKVLKIAIHKNNIEHTKHSENVVRTVIRRMMDEGEQVLVAMRAGFREKLMIEKGGITNANDIPASFLGVEDETGDTMAALFTSIDERDEIDDDDITGVPFTTILKFVKDMQHLDGIVIDPFSDKFKMNKEEIAELLDEGEEKEEDLPS